MNMNTYGLLSVNQHTFNTSIHDDWYYPREMRNIVVTLLRVHNLVLNVAAFTTYHVTGSYIRICSGIVMAMTTLLFGDPNALSGMIIGRWYYEAISTAIMQIIRGLLDLYFAGFINLVLDIVFSLFNLAVFLLEERDTVAHNDVQYPLVFSWLYLV